LFGIHLAGITIPTIDDGLDGFEGYITPLNSMGVMMFPTKASAESAVRGTEKLVYAIKPMTGGKVRAQKSGYLRMCLPASSSMGILCALLA
jgi:hypothetical protein